MADIAWQIEHSEETGASRGFVWAFWTDVDNWEDASARFSLDGPFAAGTQGTTVIAGQEPRRWRIRDVRPPASYLIETDLDGATLGFEWRFDPVSERRTKITQRIVLSGQNASEYVEAVRIGFGSNLAAGMERIAELIAAAESMDE